jgi:hypothetical protein
MKWLPGRAALGTLRSSPTSFAFPYDAASSLVPQKLFMITIFQST